ncbi:MAG: hypothetical protein NTU49_02825 [Gammaproteobacteria bacterium]|nr:hypothetical protein [Gammaproteobacteria bacterium]
MTIKTVKRQIKAMEQRLRFDRENYAEKRIAYRRHAENLKYLWFLLPISGFFVGFRKNIVVVTTVVVFLKSQAFYWLRQNIQSKLVLALLG